MTKDYKLIWKYKLDAINDKNETLFISETFGPLLSSHGVATPLTEEVAFRMIRDLLDGAPAIKDWVIKKEDENGSIFDVTKRFLTLHPEYKQVG